MAGYTVNDIRIDFGMPIIILKSFQVHVGVNQHGTLSCAGIISPESAQQSQSRQWTNQVLYASVGNTRVFSGMIQKLRINRENGICHFSLSAGSMSTKLDMLPQKYFYQDTRQTWADVVKKSAKQGGGSAIATRGKDRILIPILQYCETPWDFCLRMAAKIGTVITPDCLSAEPAICLGIPKQQANTINPLRIRMNRHIFAAQKDAVYFKEKNAGESYQVDDEQIFHLGDLLTAGDLQYPVVEAHYTLLGELVQNRYTLAPETTVRRHPWNHDLQAGLVLYGAVKAAAADRVRVCLDIPDDAQRTRAQWFDYAPVTNNGMYAMPPRGTRIALEWRSTADGDIKAIHTLRDGAELPDDYERRSLITEYDRQLRMGPNFLLFTSGSNNFVLRNGIRISTGGRLRLRARKGIVLSADQRLRIRSPEEVFVTKTGVVSNIWMKTREIHFKSADTKIYSSGRGKLLPVPHREPMYPVSIQARTLATVIGSVPKSAAAGEK